MRLRISSTGLARTAEAPDYKVIEKELLKRFSFGFDLGVKGGDPETALEDLQSNLKAAKATLGMVERLLEHKPTVANTSQAKALLTNLAKQLNAVAPRLGGIISINTVAKNKQGA